jgi:sulfate permease, SulP family
MLGISRLLRDKGVQQRVVGLSPAITQAFRESGGLGTDAVVLNDIDEALEQGEEIVLAAHITGSSAPPAFGDWISSILGTGDSTEILQRYLIATHYKSDDYVCRQGEPTDDLYLIEAGRLSAIIENDIGAPMRLRSFGANTIVGEIGFVLNVPRTASLRVDRDAIIWSLNREAFRDLNVAQPGIMLALLQSVVRLQVERLSFAMRRIASLQP